MSKLVDICDYTENSYRPVVDYGAWRVAYLNNTTDDVSAVEFLERHTASAEVFVLVQGACKLLVSPTGNAAYEVYEMEPLKLYNVLPTTFHQVAMQPGCRLLIVENRDTGADNSLYCRLTAEQKEQVRTLLQI